MTRQKKRRPALTSRQAQANDEMEAAARWAWAELQESLKEGIDNGDLAKQTSPEHALAMDALLREHAEVAGSLFLSGFLSAVGLMKQVAQLAMASIPHDCTEPGHNHGPAANARIGRA